MSPDFKLENRDLDTVSLENEIEKRIEERKAAGVYSHEVVSLLAERLPEEDGAGELPPLAALDYSSTRAMSSWEVSTAYPVATEKKIIAPIIIFVKRIARLWARIAVGPIQRDQTAFNRHAANALEALKKEAVAQRARERAGEEDLSELAAVLISDEQNSWIADNIAAEIKTDLNLTVLSPCPNKLISLLAGKGYSIYRISTGSTWEEAGSGSGGDSPDHRRGKIPPATIQTPAAFLCRAPEESIRALLVSELAFINDPGRIVDLLRKSYLALKHGGRIVVVVHGLATGIASPWCAPQVIVKALGLAGFADIHVKSGPDGTAYVALAGK